MFRVDPLPRHTAMSGGWMRDVTPAEAAAQLRAAARATNKAARAALEQAGVVTIPIMRRQAQAAAGPNRRLRNMPQAGVLTAFWKVTGRLGVYQASMTPSGPWRIRDNSYSGGNTRPHVIVARRAPYLIFEYQGRIVRRISVNHPGSAREPFWKQGVDEAIPFVVEIVPREQLAAVAAAFARPGSFLS